MVIEESAAACEGLESDNGSEERERFVEQSRDERFVFCKRYPHVNRTWRPIEMLRQTKSGEFEMFIGATTRVRVVVRMLKLQSMLNETNEW